MNRMELIFPDDMTQFDPGAEIAVEATWELDEIPDHLEVRLVWHTTGKGDRDLKQVKTVTISSSTPSGRELVTLSLPWGPYSFSGKLISLIWGIELVALPSEDSTRRVITVAPQGQEVLLQSTT